MKSTNTKNKAIIYGNIRKETHELIVVIIKESQKPVDFNINVAITNTMIKTVQEGD